MESDMDKSKINTNIPIVGGPCSAESREQMRYLGEWAAKQGWRRFRAGIWKPRTKPGGFEGMGEQALEWLVEIQEEFQLKGITEVATAGQAEKVLKAGLSGFWVGARTTGNPFYVQEIADVVQGAPIEVWVKNPIQPDIAHREGAIERFQKSEVQDVRAIHRGFYAFRTSVYRNSPMWSIPLGLKKTFPQLEMYCDISHIAGNVKLLPELARQARHLDFEGLMIEIHNQPERALTDAHQQIHPVNLPQLVEHWNHAGTTSQKEMDEILRQEKKNWNSAIQSEIERLVRFKKNIPDQMRELNPDDSIS
jgi:chorismate mutase